MLDLGCLGILLSFQLLDVLFEPLFNYFSLVFDDLPDGNLFVAGLPLSF